MSGNFSPALIVLIEVIQAWQILKDITRGTITNKFEDLLYINITGHSVQVYVWNIINTGEFLPARGAFREQRKGQAKPLGRGLTNDCLTAG